MDCGEVSFSLDIWRIFTRVQPQHYCPVLAAGGRLAHTPEPRAESLETDLASGGVVTEDGGASVQRG